MRKPKVNSVRHMFLWLSGAMVFLLTGAGIIGVMTHSTRHSAAKSVRYARYLSPPRQDGTRFTFLYPIALGQPIAGGAAYFSPSAKKQYHLQDVGVQTHFNPSERWMQSNAILRRVYPQNVEDIRVSSTDDTSQPDPFPAGRRIQSENPHYIRSETSSMNEGAGQHTIVVTDMRSGTRYYFQHSYWGSGTADASAASFAADDTVIARSFRVLPAGTMPSVER